MNIKPSDFFISVTDFFSVLLPGALVTYFLSGIAYHEVFGDGKVFPEPQSQAALWIVFFTIAYITGNIVFLIASILLDKWVYDRFLRNRFFKKNFDLAYLCATEARDSYLSSHSLISRLIHNSKLHKIDADKLMQQERIEVLPTYKWAQHFLAVKSPEALTEIKKLEADSKFFRSLVAAFVFIAIFLLFKAEFGTAALFFFFSLLSLYRYADLRYKSTERAYEMVITLINLQAVPEGTHEPALSSSGPEPIKSGALDVSEKGSQDAVKVSALL